MKTLITAIQAKIATLPSLKYIDQDWGQLDFFADFPPAKFPCALINIDSIAWTNEGRHAQLGTATLTILVAAIKLTNSSSKAPQAQKDNALSIFDVLQSVHLALHGWAPGSTYGSLIRTATTRIKRDDGIQLFSLTYTCSIKDTTAVGEPGRAPATPAITTQRLP